jgi:hypothetical protein
MQQSKILSRWDEIKHSIRVFWGGVSEEELDRCRGDLSAVAELIEQRYGESKNNIKNKLDQLLASYEHETQAESSYERRPQEQIVSIGKLGNTLSPHSDGQDRSLSSFGGFEPR